MDPLFDRLGNLIRSMFQDGSSESYDRRSSSHSADPDMKDAWEELDDFLKQDPSPGTAGKKRSASPPAMPPLKLKNDYELLEVPFGAPFSQVKKGYKKMITRYHPDKHSDNQESLDRATDLSQKINGAFRRIERYEEKGRL